MADLRELAEISKVILISWLPPALPPSPLKICLLIMEVVSFGKGVQISP